MKQQRRWGLSAAVGQATTVVVLGGWCGWTTYLSAPSWAATLPSEVYPLVGVGAGIGAAAAVVAGLVCAREAGARAGRREISDYLAARARHLAAYAGHRRQVNDARVAGGAARWVLGNASAGRGTTPPPGAQGAAAGSDD